MHRNDKRRQTLIIVFAFLLGLCLGLWLSKNARIVRHVLRCHQMVYLVGENRERPQTLRQEVKSNTRFLLVGVFMKTLNERKTGILYNDFSNEETDITFVFFTTTRAKPSSLHNRPVVYLKGIASDTEIYLSMFSHVTQKYATKFNWFMLIYSSFFVNIEKLSFLRSLDYSKDFLFLPEASVHNGSRIDTRGSNRIDNLTSYRETTEYDISNMDLVQIFQPGMTMSRSLMQKLSTLTEHCFNKTNGFQKCFENTVTISWLNEENNSTSSEEEILNSAICRTQYKDLITKTVTADLSNDLDCLYRLRIQLLSKRVRMLSKNHKKLQTKLNTLKSFISNTVYEKIEEIRTATYKGFKQKVQHGRMFTLGKNFPISNKVPWSLHNHKLEGIARIIRTVMKTISNAHQENIQFHALYYGYVLNQPIKGLQYRLNIFTNKERHIARSTQEFGAIQSRVLEISEKTTVNIVVPLAGRLQNFKQFMKNLERNILKKPEPISILVVYFPETAPSAEHRKIFDQYNMTYKGSTFNWLDLPGVFARARALQAAVEFHKDSKLLFFSDVDLSFNTDFLQRCRDNTVAKQRVYFPVMFKLFNPKILGFKLNSTDYFRSFDREVGDWALYSFGPVCVYRDDVISIGGFKVGIKEWGYEDIQLFDAFISRNKYDVIRAADPGLLHIYHAHTKCDVIKNNIQRLMCTGAMLNGLASEDSIVNYLLKKSYFKL